MEAPLVNAARFTDALEDTYQMLWRRWCATQTAAESAA